MAGIQGAVVYAATSALPLLAFPLLVPILRKKSPDGFILTMWVQKRYGIIASLYLSALSLGTMLLYMVAELSALQQVNVALTGLDGLAVVIVEVIVTSVYTDVLSKQEKDEFESVALAHFLQVTGDKKFMVYSQVPNIHLALHYKLDVENYGTTRNSATLLGEEKHKIFNRHAEHTNSKQNDLQLLKAVNTIQTIRFLVNGSFSSSHPLLTHQTRDILTTCVSLGRKFALKLDTSKDAPPGVQEH
ncbi:hypothetical protein RUND412_011374 [Rhizina undulata]